MTESKIVETKTTRHLRCKLTDEERLNYGQQQADALQARDQAEDEIAEIKGTYKAKILAKDAEIKVLSAALLSGHEFRDVTCTATHDYTGGIVTTIRLDTGEAVESREMTEDERQMGLGFEGAVE